MTERGTDGDRGLRELRAGASAVRLPVAPGLPMMGYGARKGTAEGGRDPLFARALYLGAGEDVLLLESDLCLIAPAQADEVRRRIAERTGVPPARTLVGSIHTHSGPDTGFAQLLGEQPVPAHVPPLLDAMVEAATKARESAVPARLGVGHARARIGRNRRLADGPLDEDVLVVRVDAAGGTPMAVAWVHGCHPTALGHDNLAWSADWPGAAAAVVAEALPGAMPMFLLGAHADVDPRTRGLLDLAVPNQSVGVSFEEAEALGREIGWAVAEAARAIATRADAPVAARSTRVRVPALGAAEGDRAAALRALDLPPDHPARTGELFAMEHERTKDLPADERRERIARVRLYLRNRTAWRFAFGREPAVEVQVLRLGPARLLALPLEPTVAVGLDWKARAGTADAAVVGIANGWMRYLPHGDDWAEPLAHQKYEVLQASLVPEAAARLLEAGAALDAEIERELVG